MCNPMVETNRVTFEISLVTCEACIFLIEKYGD